jgi:hypothetical protein
MVEHHEDSGSYDLDVEENIYVRIITGLQKILIIEPSG